MSQIVLQKIKFVANYNYVVPKGNYFLFAVEPLRNSLVKTIDTFCFFADDVLNTNRNAFQTPLLISNKQDTRKFGFSNYKIQRK
jgi:hypothetical protein